MGSWRKYRVGPYRLGQLKGVAVVKWRDSSGPHRRSLGVTDEIAARAALDAWARTVNVIKASTAQPTVGEIWNLYRADRELDGKQVSAMDWHWKALESRFSALLPHAIDANVCRDYARTRFAAGKSQNTAWTELTQLRSLLNWARKRKVISDSPYVWVPSKPRAKTRVLSQEEVYSLVEAAKTPHIRLFIALALTTGGRTAAILQLTWDRVDLEAGTIDLREPETVNPLTKAVRKGRAIVSLADDLKPLLRDAKDGALTDHVIEWDAQPVKSVVKGFTTARKAAGLSADVTPHILRHTVASLSADAGVPMLKISRFLGHREQRTTETIYAKTSPGYTADVAKVVRLRKRP